MSNYKDLCDIYRESRNRYFDFEKDCIEFAETLIGDMMDYLSIPTERIKLFPTLGEADATLIYSIKEAMRLGADTFWHLGIGIELQCEDCPDTPDQPVLINLRLRREDGNFIVKLSDKDKGNKIKKDCSNASEFFETLFTIISDTLENSVNRYLEKNSVDCRIGFHSKGD